jgi:hypothetical protein
MRSYEQLITRTKALYDGPSVRHHKKLNIYDFPIFKRLLVYDQIPDNDLTSVLREAGYTLGMADPAFELQGFDKNFEQYIHTRRHESKWMKISKDYLFYIQTEKKRRNKFNPYAPEKIEEIADWLTLPNYSKQKPHQGWQYDSLFRDAQYFTSQLLDFIRTSGLEKDKDHFRLRVNGILTPSKIIYALNANESMYTFAENEINAINVKLSLDGYSLALTFLERAVESLHKIMWSSDEASKPFLTEALSNASSLSEKIKTRTKESERNFILFMDALTNISTD